MFSTQRTAAGMTRQYLLTMSRQSQGQREKVRLLGWAHLGDATAGSRSSAYGACIPRVADASAWGGRGGEPWFLDGAVGGPLDGRA